MYNVSFRPFNPAFPKLCGVHVWDGMLGTDCAPTQASHKRSIVDLVRRRQREKRWSNLAEHAASAVAVMAGGIGIGTAIVVAGRAAEAGQLGEKAGAVVLLAAVGVGLTALAVAMIRKRLTR